MDGEEIKEEEEVVSRRGKGRPRKDKKPCVISGCGVNTLTKGPPVVFPEHMTKGRFMQARLIFWQTFFL